VMRRGAQAERDASGAGLAADVIVAPGRRSAGPTPSNAVVLDGEWRCRLPSRISPAVVANVRAGSRQVTTDQTYFGGVRGGLPEPTWRQPAFTRCVVKITEPRPEPIDLAKKRDDPTLR
jgi:hypothetical protein